MHDSTNEILLLGNGFDIAHKFPTRYIDFLNVFQTINKHKSNHIFNEDYNLGAFFREVFPKERNDFAVECYEKHKEAYDNINISFEDLCDIVDFTNNNFWFKYLSSCLNADIVWVDFEKEIALVIKTFDEILKSNNYQRGDDYQLSPPKLGPNERNVLKNFSFFYETNQNEYNNSIRRSVHKDYLLKHPYNNTYRMNKDKIIEYLYDSLCELETIFSLYISYFIEKVLDYENNENNKLKEIFKLKDRKCDVISFNYTTTYEKIYGNENEIVSHIHGSQKYNNAILGIQPSDEHDVIEGDTSFIEFKKYYQRIKRKTDLDYLAIIQRIKGKTESKKFYLYVIGHSLDVTDSDILRFLMDNVDCMVIYYHNDIAFGDYVKNIVRIYGKDKMDEMRLSGKLVFLPLETLYMK